MLFCASEVLKKQTNKKQNIMDIGLIQQSTFLSDSCGGGVVQVSLMGVGVQGAGQWAVM